MKFTRLRVAPFFGALALVLSLRAEIITPDRRIDWSSAGVENGIPSYPQWCDATVNIPGTSLLAVGDGTTDCTAAIQFALDHCPLGQAVYLPAGTYRISATVGNAGLRITRGVVLRGHVNGTTSLPDTVITTSAAVHYVVGIGASSEYTGNMQFPDFSGTGPYDGYGPVTNITADAAKGDTSVQVADTTNYPVGKIVRIDQRNSPISPYAQGPLVSIQGQQAGLATWVSRDSGTRALGQLARITGRSTSSGAGTLQFTPALLYGRDVSGGYLPQVVTTMYTSFLSGAGLENVKLSWTYGSHVGCWPLQMVTAYNCWANNVEITPCDSGYIYLEASFHCEIRHCYLHDPGTAGVGEAYGVQGGGGDSLCLVVDNAIVGTSSGVMWIEGSSGNVAAYNYVRASSAGLSGNNLWAELYACHAGHGMMNLWEGNIGEKLEADDLMGTSSHNTVFRNWLMGHPTGDPSLPSGLGEVWCLDIEAHQTSYNVVGNVLGRPGINWTYKRAYPETADWTVPEIFRFGYAAPNGSPGYSSNSTNSETTALLHGNYDYATKSQIWDSTISDHTLPASLFLGSTKPTWWDGGSWPAIGPDVTTTNPSNPAARRITTLAAPRSQPPLNVRISPALR
jgi:hypothetical protein